MVSISGMAVSLKTDLRFPITGQQGHESRNIQIVIIRIIYRTVTTNYKSFSISILSFYLIIYIIFSIRDIISFTICLW